MSFAKIGLSALVAVVWLSVWVPLQAGAAPDVQFGPTIASANGRVMAIQDDGSLWYWGKATFNDTAGDQSPQRAVKTKILDNVVRVYGAWWTSFAVKADHSLWSIQYEDDAEVTKPVKVMDNVQEAASAYSQWIVLKTDGTVWQMEAQGDAQSAVKIMSGVKQISAGIESFYALKPDGTLWGWGNNYSGALGVKSAKTYVAEPIEIMADTELVYGTGMEAYAVKKDGTLWGWGADTDGLLLPGPEINWAFAPYEDGSRSVVASHFMPEKLMEGVQAVDGDNHLAVIKKDRSLWVWGYNGSGELGDGTTESASKPQVAMDDIAEVTAKGGFTVALKTDGTLWGFGSNGAGELGTGSFDNEPHTTPRKLMEHVALPGAKASFPSGWALDEVRYAKQEGLLPRALQADYQSNITRGEFIKLLVPLLEEATGKKLDALIREKGLTSAAPFTDTEDIDVQRIAACGIISGTGGGRFEPDGLLTREQAAVILSNAARFLGLSEGEGAGGNAFDDGSQIASWAQAAVQFCAAAGVMQGTAERLFSPKAPYSREMSTITVAHLYKRLLPQA
ncbi:S-layer homology domain-containing protein [Paenibacillus athensensis]|nr:S-layer homology domain-containing protein [Paenibacillus athensensis]MCD1258526.1 S-layer homology domain-containing protein [Paenibacillus athensensis]